MITPGWIGLPPVELLRTCAEAEHRVVWKDGELQVPDHPDAERERALTALGADPIPCLDLLDAWRRHVEDLDVLVLASRGPSDALPVEEDGEDDAVVVPAAFRPHYLPMSRARRGPPISRGWTMYPPGHQRYVDKERAALGLDDLLRLGHGLPERLAATVITTWAQRLEAGDERAAAARPQLRAALYGRLLDTVRGWTGTRISLDLVMSEADDRPDLSRSGDSVVVKVPFGWLRDVWVNGLAIVLGQLCLLAQRSAEDEWHLLTASRDEPTSFAQWNLTRTAIANG